MRLYITLEKLQTYLLIFSLEATALFFFDIGSYKEVLFRGKSFS